MPKQQSSSKQKSKNNLDEPKKYKVIMHNDDITTMDFVVDVLMKVFFKTKTIAKQLMMEIHTQGQAIVGVYSYDIAISKSKKAMALASEKNFPLKLTWSPE
ncbi:MAG: ATP-dependent Clp protease adaptor ClpS [Bacteroidales bacterium]|nr:ATP-dependent Clp protease adaptor ClpS [Bacteroidales bacterium]